MGDGYQTWAEIEAKYPGEWVLVDRLRPPLPARSAGGRVVWHNPDRDVFDSRLLDFTEVEECAVRYTGREPVDEIFLMNAAYG